MQGFYLMFKFKFGSIYIRKAYLRFYWEKLCSIHYLHFSFEKHVPSQDSKYLSVENLETTLSTLPS